MSYATDHAAFFKLPPQGPDETDIGFRNRVRDALREQGHVIEAAEAFYDKRWNESPDVMASISGATANAVDGKPIDADADIIRGDLERRRNRR